MVSGGKDAPGNSSNSILIRGVKYVLNIMRKCIMVKVGEAKKWKKEIRENYKYC